MSDPATVEHRPAARGRPPLEIHRSRRRRRSAQAHPRGAALVVRLPAGLAVAEEEQLIDRLVAQATGRAAASALGGDAALVRRAAELADRYVDGVRPASIRWVGGMQRRYGSCSAADGVVRISRAVAAYPTYVRDYVIVHELAHLIVADHSPAFEALVHRYPQTQRARGWLEGHAAGWLAASTPADLEAGAPQPCDQPPGAPPPGPPSSGRSSSDPSSSGPASSGPSSSAPAAS